MNSNQFLTIAYNKKAKLIPTITRYILKRTKIKALTISPEELEDLLLEVIIRTAERINSGANFDFDSEDKIKKFLTVATFQGYNNLTTKLTNRGKFKPSEYIDTFYSETEAGPELVTTSSEIYTQAFKYVYANYSFLEAGLFKAYTVNNITNSLKGEKKFTLQRLSKMSGYSLNKCQTIIQKIKEDLKTQKENFLIYK